MMLRPDAHILNGKLSSTARAAVAAEIRAAYAHMAATDTKHAIVYWLPCDRLTSPGVYTSWFDNKDKFRLDVESLALTRTLNASDLWQNLDVHAVTRDYVYFKSYNDIPNNYQITRRTAQQYGAAHKLYNYGRISKPILLDKAIENNATWYELLIDTAWLQLAKYLKDPGA